MRWRDDVRGPAAVIFVGAPGMPDPGYFRALVEVVPEIRAWGGRVLVVVPEPGVVPEKLDDRRGPIRVVVDRDGEARRRCGVARGESVLVVADRWGQIYQVERPREGEAFPTPDAIVAWFRFLATQCPECGVPDEPGRGEWRQ